MSREIDVPKIKYFLNIILYYYIHKNILYKYCILLNLKIFPG